MKINMLKSLLFWRILLLLVSHIFPLSVGVAAEGIIEGLGGVATEETLTDKYEIQTAVYQNISIVDEPLGENRKVLKMELHAEDPKVYNGYRTEVIPKYDYVVNGIRWYAISVMVPSDWPLSSAPFVMGQLHVAQKGTSLPPAISVVLRDKNLYFVLQRTNFDVYDPEKTMVKEDLTTLKVPIGELTFNKWECYVIRVDWSSVKDQGELDIWSSTYGKIYEERLQHNMYPSHLGSYPKTGLYAPWKLDAQMRYVYSDFIWVGNESSNYADMYNLTPCHQGAFVNPSAIPVIK